MAKESNLIVPSSEQARINGAKGGKIRAENRRKRKANDLSGKGIIFSMPIWSDSSGDLYEGGDKLAGRAAFDDSSA